MRRTFLLLPLLLAGFTAGASQILDPPVSARATGLGYAGSTVHENGYASYWNPAVLPRLESWSVALTQAKMGGDTQLYYAGLSLPVKPSVAVSLSWSNLVITDQGKTEILRDESGKIIVDPYTGKPEEVIVGFYDESDNVFGFGLGMGSERFSIGGTMKLVYNLFSNDRAVGVGADAGMTARMGRLDLGIAAKNVGDTRVDWKRMDDASAGSSLRVDGGIKLYEGEKAGVDAVVNGYCGGYFDADDERADFGLELGLMGLVCLRLGAQGGDLATGLGFGFDRLAVDYAFTQSEEFYSSHRISVELRGAGPQIPDPPVRRSFSEGGRPETESGESEGDDE